MSEGIPIAARVYADNSFPTTVPTLRIRTEWENVDVSEGDKMVMVKDAGKIIDERIKSLKKDIRGPSDSSEAKARKDELESLKSEFITNKDAKR